MKKKKKERFGYYRVALCRGLGFRKITEDEFIEGFLLRNEPMKYLLKGRYAIFSASWVHTGYRSNGEKVFCTDDYIYIRKAYR